MKFDDYFITPEIKKSLDQMGFKRPTDIQFKSIPAVLNGEDVLAIAQTGTGKTAAFAIPILHTLQQKKANRRGNAVNCLVMVPTRELAAQITKVFKTIAKYSKLSIFGLYGGVEQDDQIQKLESGVDVLIATPGRMFDLSAQGHLDLSRVEVLVLDEADKMLDQSFIKDIHDVKKQLPKKHQTLFFSATINKEIKSLAFSLVRNAIRIQVSPKDPVSKNVNHSLMYIAMDDKRFFLERIVKENPEKKILAFVRTRVRADRVVKAMERVNISAEDLHGGKDQKQRQQILERFRKGENKLLIATDVSARGIDIPDVDLVVNYDMPDDPEYYVHRVGRTGRGTKKGTAISFCSESEKEVTNNIEGFLGTKIALTEVPTEEYKGTIEFSEDHTQGLKDMIKEIEFFEERKHKKAKKKRKK